jgi:primary-amine oxidase
VRLDVGIDGIHNTIQQLDAVADTIEESNTFENAFHLKATDLQTEQQSLAHLNLESGRTWRIINPKVKNAVGQPVGYKFFPGDNAFPIASPNAWWRKRARFVDHHVWVTPFQAEEKYAAGDYPNQSGGGDGLIRWTAANRAIANADVVLWYTFGHTHIPRTEDYPVMPTAYIGFLLKPNGFFDQNPANDVPPSAPAASVKTCCSHS